MIDKRGGRDHRLSPVSPGVAGADRQRCLAALPFLAVGGACIIAGGLVAALTASAPSEGASWAAAYLVLVTGVAQIVLGVGHAVLADRGPSRRAVVLRFGTWTAGNALVLAGTLLGALAVLDVGGGLLVLSLALFVHGVRGARPRPAWPLHAFRVVVVVLLVSVPIGLVLAWIEPVP